jgi:3-deoxy-D-manno-octulosonic-acid transferase
MLNFYKLLTRLAEPVFLALLRKRAESGKENTQRLAERRGESDRKRPPGPMLWLHAASVGEAQSALLLIEDLLRHHEKLHLLLTTGTVTSASLMEKKLPERAFHQFYPLDHPDWVEKFLNHWHPDFVLWLESEIWPNMLLGIRDRNLPAVLVNARLSDKSFKRWRLAGGTAKSLLNAFSLILTQTDKDAHNFRALGATNVSITGNMKFSARPLPADEKDLKTLSAHIRSRPTWLYASSHKGEEEMACRVHQILKTAIPEILTVIVPRHIGRREDIQAVCKQYGLASVLRGADKTPPGEGTDIYIADTMGELGLFYRVAPVACIGRSFSADGGGGHNPIEAAQLNCAVLHGPHVRHQQQIYDDMDDAGAALLMKNEQDLTEAVRLFLTNEDRLRQQQAVALRYVQGKSKIIDKVMKALNPLLENAQITRSQQKVKSA